MGLKLALSGGKTIGRWPALVRYQCLQHVLSNILPTKTSSNPIERVNGVGRISQACLLLSQNGLTGRVVFHWCLPVSWSRSLPPTFRRPLSHAIYTFSKKKHRSTYDKYLSAMPTNVGMELFFSNRCMDLWRRNTTFLHRNVYGLKCQSWILFILSKPLPKVARNILAFLGQI